MERLEIKDTRGTYVPKLLRRARQLSVRLERSYLVSGDYLEYKKQFPGKRVDVYKTGANP